MKPAPFPIEEESAMRGVEMSVAPKSISKAFSSFALHIRSHSAIFYQQDGKTMFKPENLNRGRIVLFCQMYE